MARARKKVEEKKPFFGIVTNCLRLNMRKEPNTDSDIVMVLHALASVEIDPNNSTDEWWKVKVGAKEGYCNKKCITVKK